MIPTNPVQLRLLGDGDSYDEMGIMARKLSWGQPKMGVYVGALGGMMSRGLRDGGCVRKGQMVGEMKRRVKN